MDKISKFYFLACKEAGLSPVKIPEINGFKIILKGKNYYFRNGNPPINNITSFSIANNKYATNAVLNLSGIPVPKAKAITKKEFKKGELDITGLNFPLVIKPTWDSSCGRGVICGIKNKDLLISLLEKSFKKYHCMSIEEFQEGLNSYRILVVYQKVIGIVQRIPAHIIGDGQHSIEQLITIKNTERAALKKKLPLGSIKILDETEIIFQERNISKEYIPWPKEIIPLRYICNSTWGGNIIGLNAKKIHPHNAKLASDVAHALNLNIVGIDFICEDIKKSHHKTRAYVIECNANPDITIHENTIAGEKCPVSNIIIDNFLKRQHDWSLLNINRVKYLMSAICTVAISLLLCWIGLTYVLK